MCFILAEIIRKITGRIVKSRVHSKLQHLNSIKLDPRRSELPAKPFKDPLRPASLRGSEQKRRQHEMS